MSLHAWGDSSDSPERRVSRLEWRSRLGWHVDHLRLRVTRPSGLFLGVGVIWKVILCLVRLFLRWQISYFGSADLGSFPSPLFWASVLCWLLFFVLSCLRYPPLLCYRISCGLLRLAVPVHSVRPPCWDLEVVLGYLRLSAFEPISSLSLRSLTKKVLFLVSLATARRVIELQALSSFVPLSSSVACGVCA